VRGEGMRHFAVKISLDGLAAPLRLPLKLEIAGLAGQDAVAGHGCGGFLVMSMGLPGGRCLPPATGKSKREIAALLGISRQHLYDILAQRKPVSPAVSVRLGKLFGDGAGVWVRMQGAYDIWHAERDLAAEIRKIPRLKVAAA